MVQARTGVTSVQAEGKTPGTRYGISVLSTWSSRMWVAMGIMAALFQGITFQLRAEGLRVDGSLYQTGNQWMAYHLVSRQMTGVDPQPWLARQGDRLRRSTAAGIRGYWSTSRSDRLFDDYACVEQAGIRAIRSANAGRVRHREILDGEIASVLASRATPECARHSIAWASCSAIRSSSESWKSMTRRARADGQARGSFPASSHAAARILWRAYGEERCASR